MLRSTPLEQSAKAQLIRFLARISVGVLLLILLALGKIQATHTQASPLIQAAATAPATEDADQVTEKLVDVGSYRLYIRCLGHGSPTVILDAGYPGDSISDWSGLQPLVGKFTHVCAYDRVWRGRSSAGAKKSSLSQYTTDLNNLLANAQIPGPYVLAGF